MSKSVHLGLNLSRRTILSMLARAAALAVAAAFAPGCNDPRYDAARERHNRSIEKVVTSIEENEATRDERMRRTLSIIEQDAAARPEKLQRTVQKIQDDARARDERWKRMQPVWNQRLRAMMAGDSEGPDDAFAKMFY